jgi:SAM-dependent methyltransferase/uncharacterized protein YbaR (Trm112 family)
MSAASPFLFACPICRSPLLDENPAQLRCPTDGSVYCKVDGIWYCLPDQLRSSFQQFIPEYEHIRLAEGRGADTPTYYRALPFQDLTGRFQADWQIRSRSYQTLIAEIVLPLEKRLHRPLQILDLGAGNCWLSYRLAQRAHNVAAVDLSTNPLDGLGAWIHYDAAFTPIQADFDHLPFQDNQLDLVIYNASLHYSRHYENTLSASWRLLQPCGVLVILDSPLYHSAGSGVQMVREREAQFLQTYGFPSNGLDSENFLTYERLAVLSQHLGVDWRLIRPFYNLGWELRPWKARLRGQREPARFALIIASKGTVPVSERG